MRWELVRDDTYRRDVHGDGREELRDAAENHEDADGEVDDATAIARAALKSAGCKQWAVCRG